MEAPLSPISDRPPGSNSSSISLSSLIPKAPYPHLSHPSEADFPEVPLKFYSGPSPGRVSLPMRHTARCPPAVSWARPAVLRAAECIGTAYVPWQWPVSYHQAHGKVFWIWEISWHLKQGHLLLIWNSSLTSLGQNHGVVVFPSLVITGRWTEVSKLVCCCQCICLDPLPYLLQAHIEIAPLWAHGRPGLSC